jgi:small-conductance mechanosensitive channel
VITTILNHLFDGAPLVSVAVQMVLVVGAMGLAVSSSRSVLRRLKNKESRFLTIQWVSRSAVSMMGALFFLGWFFLAFLGASVFIDAPWVMVAGFKLAMLLFITGGVIQIVQQRVIPIFVGGAGGILLFSHDYGQFGGVIEKINAVGVTIGSVRLTPLSLVNAIVLLVVLSWGTSRLVDWMNAQIECNRQLKSNTKALLSKSLEVLTYFLATVVGLNLLGIDLTALTVVGGALGVGIGFGLQKITSNFISGIILLLEKTIETGDLIQMEGGIYGYVRQINARYTLIETFDGKEVMVPNENFMTDRVTNWTFSHSKGRIEIPIGVSYKSDIKLAQSLILEAANEHPRTIHDPKPDCYLLEFADSSVNFLLYFFVEDVTQGRYQPQSEVMMAIWEKFKTHGIEIPYPQRDIHIKQQDSL